MASKFLSSFLQPLFPNITLTTKMNAKFIKFPLVTHNNVF